ncbi:lysozyme family protein [Bacillus rubiinfantis]|uniref:lysozyme family protein n=1 Tax=Bacillus rubiinfantis TaxID=1499680 RepID=UPI000AAC2EEC|nr:lysozyme family protein [Bacillus rubiinfantis]
MKKRRRKTGKTWVGLLVFFVLLAGALGYFWLNPSPLPKENSDPFTAVKKYRPLLQSELKKYRLEKYTDVLLALMQQESYGEGDDPMQASESIGLPKDTITDPKQSIQAGVKHFYNVLTYGNKQKVDFPTIIQAYNMGRGYITYVAEHGGKHSEALAKQFSKLQVKKNPTLYNCGGDKTNFRYPYCYGDYSYSTKVLKNVQLLVDSIPASGENKEKTGDAF